MEDLGLKTEEATPKITPRMMLPMEDLERQLPVAKEEEMGKKEEWKTQN